MVPFKMFNMRRFFPALAGVVLVASAMEPAHAAEPSFDCAKAESAVEKLICGNTQLAELDRETARLFDLAKDEPHLTPLQRRELVTLQGDWLKQREDCTKAQDPHQCAAEAMITRIVRLRQSYPDVRQRDREGISLGPFAAHCEGFKGRIDVSYVNSNPAFAYVAEPTGSLLLKQTMSGSGARYDASYPAGKAELWTKGNGAQIALPGRSAMTCSLDVPK